jgi:AAA+ ATPase superfamily predicted ATPase
MIGREKEQSILLELAKSDHSELAVVYGRRRVGKTFLVRETFDYKFAFSHTGVENGTLRDELLADTAPTIAGILGYEVPECWRGRQAIARQ